MIFTLVGPALPAPETNPDGAGAAQLEEAQARDDAFTPSETASLLARRPYDLRHAAVSTWLNAGVPAPQVAEWAGHSVDVLLRVYAKCISGQQEDAKRRIEEATRPREDE